MSETSLTGQDTVQIDGRIITALADGTPFDLTFPNDFGTMKIGKNGNTIYAKNTMGLLADVALRVLIGSSDDQYLLGRMAQWYQDESLFVLMTATFVKRVGDGQGNYQSKIFQCTGGYFKRQVDTKTVAEGDTDQSVQTYHMQFICVPPSIQG